MSANDEEEIFKCQQCDEVFPDAEVLGQHSCEPARDQSSPVAPVASETDASGGTVNINEAETDVEDVEVTTEEPSSTAPEIETVLEIEIETETDEVIVTEISQNDENLNLLLEPEPEPVQDPNVTSNYENVTEEDGNNANASTTFDILDDTEFSEIIDIPEDIYVTGEDDLSTVEFLPYGTNLPATDSASDETGTGTEPEPQAPETVVATEAAAVAEAEPSNLVNESPADVQKDGEKSLKDINLVYQVNCSKFKPCT